MSDYPENYVAPDFTTQLKTRVFRYICIVATICLCVLLATSIIVQLSETSQGINIPLIISESLLILIFIFCLRLVKIGLYNLATHVFLISANFTVWLAMFISTGDAISQLDTVVILLALINVIPLFISKYNWTVILYVIVNFFVLLFFVHFYRDAFGLTKSIMIDYISDTSVALIFSGIAGYQLLRINKKALLKVESDYKERLKAEEDLAIIESRYKNLFESAQIGIYQTTPEGRILKANPALLKMLGYDSIKELEKINLQNENHYAKKTRQEFIELIEKHGHLKGFESEWETKNKEIIIIRENARTVRDSEGKTIYYEGFIENITLRKRAEKALKESEGKYRLLMENMNDIVMLVDNDDRVQYVNRQFINKLGYSENEIIGKIGYEVLLDPIDQEKIIKANKDRTQNKISQYEATFISKDGTKYDFLVSGAPVKDAEGNVIGSIGNMMDITEKKKIEMELEEYRKHLEIKVHERTEELAAANEELTATNEEILKQREELEAVLLNLKETQLQLVQSEKMASLGVLAAGIAHEINNPLNFIKGGVVGIEQYLKNKYSDKLNEIAPLIDGIHTGIHRAAEIVTSLNKYSRQDEGGISDCNIHEIIDSCLVMLHNQIKHKVKVVKNFTSKIPTIEGNEGRLHQAFLNILQNSIQAISEEGSIEITTELNQNRIILSIKDSGCGIPEDVLHKIMDPFFTTKDPGEGTGLGLSITYSIIREQNGTMDIKSETDIGTTVIIELPLNPKKITR